MPADPLVVTRTNLHALAERVISPLRVQATGNEIALTPRAGGFGTPELPGGGWVGVLGTEVVRVDADGAAHRAPITTLRAAAEHVALTAAGDLPDEPLEVDGEQAALLAHAWATADEALAALTAAAADGDDPSEAHLWPEHFDAAIELGADGRRANYGVSPGDDEHPRPYAYVGPWTAPEPGPEWNAVGFAGAEAPVGDVEQVLAFFEAKRALLGA